MLEWHHHILEALASGLVAHELEVQRLNDVDGLDSLREVDLHPVLAEVLRAAGQGVQREIPYPIVPGKSSRRQDAPRCDLVLTSDPTLTVADEYQLAREATRSGKSRRDTTLPLFAQKAVSAPPAAARADPADAFWLEVKIVGQFCFTEGVPGPNRTYSPELVRALSTDLAKLADRMELPFRGLLLVLFTERDEIATHDVPIALERSAQRGVPFRPPLHHAFSIRDRIGNGSCSLWLFPG